MWCLYCRCKIYIIYHLINTEVASGGVITSLESCVGWLNSVLLLHICILHKTYKYYQNLSN